MSDAKKGENHPMFGQNHTEESKTIMSEVKKGENNPMFGKNHTEETKTIMSDIKKGEKNPMYNKSKPEGAGKASQGIEVFEIKNNTTTYYDSINEAARALNISSHNIISNYIKNNQKKPYKGKYTFKKI